MKISDPSGKASGMRLLGELWQDLAYGWRGLLRNPGFTTAAVLTLMIAIGASTTMFSIVEAVLLRPLPYQDPGRLAAVWSELRREGVAQSPSGYANIEDWRSRSRSFEGMAAYDGWSAILTRADGEARRVSAMMVSANLFKVLGVQPAFGRAFTQSEADRRQGLAVLSHQGWRQHYGADPNILGRSIVLDGRPVQIVGVTPPGFYFPDKDIELWVPDTFRPDWQNVRMTRGTDSWRVVARLADGVSPEAAQGELAGIARMLESEHPGLNRGLGVRVLPYAQQAVGRATQLAFFVLAAAVGAVQLIACSNVASLLLARSAARQREFGIREALGAGRGRLVRQLLVETAVLAFVAAAAGAALAALALEVITSLTWIGIPRLDEAKLDGTVLLFTLLLAAASAVLSGLAPALGRARRNLVESLRGAGRGLSEGRAAGRLRSGLVILEFALAIVLLMVTGLLLRSFERLTALDTGFRANNVLVMGVTLPPGRPGHEVAGFQQQLIERVRALPGVRSVGASEDILLGLANEQTISASGSSPGESGIHRLRVNIDAVTPDYFRTVGASLRQGRTFTDSDGPASPPVVIINETLARRLWPDQDPIGQAIRNGGGDSDNPWMTVVGVVADLRRQRDEPDRPPLPQAFQPFTQRQSRGMDLVVATELEPGTVAAAVRATVAELDPTVPVSGVTTLRQMLDERLAPRQFHLGLVATFAAIALTLAAVGVFGLMNYSVVRRTQEIGVRMALGAQPGEVVRMVMGEGIRLALFGIAIGVAVALLLTPAIRSLLYEVSPFDPVTAAATMLVLLAVATLACYLPARRVTAIDPVIALRTER